MPRVSIVRTVDATREVLFFLSESYEARLQWDPFVRDLQFLDGATGIGKGVATRTIAYNGMSMDTEFIAYDPPHTIAMKMLRGPAMFDNMAGTWLFREGQDGQCEVTFLYSFRTRPRWLRFIMEPIVKQILRRDMERRMEALIKAASHHG